MPIIPKNRSPYFNRKKKHPRHKAKSRGTLRSYRVAATKPPSDAYDNFVAQQAIEDLNTPAPQPTPAAQANLCEFVAAVVNAEGGEGACDANY